MQSPGRLLLENRLQLLTQQLYTTALDLVFPPVCVGCERVGSFFCMHCIESLTPAPPQHVAGLEGVRTHAVFEGVVRKALHGLKYERQKRQAEPLGLLLDQALHDVDWQVDIVCPVPLHEKRLRERGYNQAALLAQVLANRRQWAFSPVAVQRCRETVSQVDLNARQRHANVDGVFEAEPNVCHAKTVLLVDDVLTTGATLAACADALRAVGATCVYAVTVAGAARSEIQADHVR